MKAGTRVRFLTKNDPTIPFGTEGDVSKFETFSSGTIFVLFPKFGKWLVGTSELEILTKIKKKTKSKGKKK